MNELITWAGLGTFAGAVAATLLIVQYVKPAFPSIDTRLMALAIALLIQIGVTLIANGLAQDYALAVFNAVLVASSAMGAYQVTFASGDAAKKADTNENG